MHKAKMRRAKPKGRRPIRSNRSSSNKEVKVEKYINKVSDLPEEKEYINQHSFEDFDLHPEILTRISHKGYEKPTEIQDKAIKMVQSGRDIIGVAGTGTGKTATFLLPIIHNLIFLPKQNYVLIVAPTRELASQIALELKYFTKGMPLYHTLLIGGTSVKKSIQDLKRRNHFIIGTPGRICDMLERKLLPIKEFEVLVLDEFDRMLDMGFVKEVMRLNYEMLNKKQTLLFSATVDSTQQRYIDTITDNPIEIKAGKGTHKTKAIAQDILRIPKGFKKMDILKDIILHDDAEKILVFCETKRSVDKIFKHLKGHQIDVGLIHGDKSHRERESALRKFKKGHSKVLIATDVLARGIDISGVDLVINYEIPKDYSDYVHRIGRTGRAGKIGKAITLIDSE